MCVPYITPDCWLSATLHDRGVYKLESDFLSKKKKKKGKKGNLSVISNDRIA